MNHHQRNKNRATALALHYKTPPTWVCPNCGEKTHHGHFVPPYFGGKGFYICKSPASKEAP